jgi:hydroxymethylpyrimidine/phosphomethylpyrimidine kinase
MHDATGASGVAADIEAIRSQECHPCTVITCLSVQDSQMVSSLIPIDADIVAQTARAVLEDMSVDVIKIGLVGSDETAQVIHEILRDYAEIPVVFDPMLVSSNGLELAGDDTIEAVRELLVPLTNILTLNSLEASMLMPEADNPAAMMNGLMDLGCDHILLSGRREAGNDVVNTLHHNYRIIEQFEWPRLALEYYGAGGTLSSSLAALLARGLDNLNACREAQGYCWHSLEQASRYGMGQYQPTRFYWMNEAE